MIDNTSAFRYVDEIPLVVPEVNPHALADVRPGAIIANPNCSTIQMLVALAPIHRAAGIDRINVATYQSVSGAGASALRELVEQTVDRLNFREPKLEKFAQPIAFNVLPQIDTMQDNGYTREEMKMVWETQKIFEDPEIRVNATAVRVPVLYGHSEAVHLETRDDIGIDEVRELLSAAPGVEVVDGAVYIAEAFAPRVERIDLATGELEVVVDEARGFVNPLELLAKRERIPLAS